MDLHFIQIMKQYEKEYPSFRFIGPSPIDYDAHEYNGECVWEELCKFNLYKTHLLINNLQIQKGLKQTEVLSPTFNLLYEYEIKDLKIMHYDLYRIKKANE